MDQKNMLKSIGYLLKKEKLASLATNKHINELILEDLDQYPAYYDQFFIPVNEKEKRPRSIFLMLKEFDICQEDHFIRITKKIKRDHFDGFDAALGSIQLFNQQTPCIRVYMEDYTRIDQLVEKYKEKGLHFLPYRSVPPYLGLIKIRKFFELSFLAKGIYKDCDLEDTYYLRVPKFLEWDDFECMTIQIRNNWTHKIYDSAQAAIFDEESVIELVRIFDLNTDLEKLTYLQERYTQEMNR